MDTAKLPVPNDSAGESPLQIKMDILVGYVLLCGVLLSLVLIAVGLGWQWIHSGTTEIEYQLAGMNLFQLLLDVFRRAGHGAIRPRLFITFGIVVLMLTPFVRVLASVIYFTAVLRNWKYTVFTLIVLIILTYSLFLR